MYYNAEDPKHFRIVNANDNAYKLKCSKQPKRLKEELKNLLELNKSLVVKLNELIERAQKLRVDCLIAKTTGVSAAAVGSSMVIGGWIAGLVMAIPTFGVSLTIPAIVTVAGTVTAVAGGLTTAGTEIANGIITKQFLAELNDIQVAQKIAVEETEDTLRKINHIITELKKDEAMSEKMHESLIIALLLQNIESGEVDLDNLDESIQKLKLKLRTCKPDEINGYSTRNVAYGGVRVAGATLNLTTAVMYGGTALIDDVAVAVLRSIGIGTGSAVVVGALRGVAASVGVIFTVFDIVTLVNDYKEANIMIKELERIKKLYLTDIDSCQNALLVLK